jgi:hypothetical protein
LFSTKKLLFWLIVLILYKFLLDSTLHFNYDFEPINTFLKEIFVILLLPVFESVIKRKKFLLFILIFSIPAITFGILQINHPNINLDNLIPHNEFIFTPRITNSYLNTENRIVGTFDLAIGFALLLGILCIIIWSKLIMSNKMIKIAFGLTIFLAIHFLIIFTQTRSAIYGIIPSILLAYAIIGKNKIKKIVLVSGLSIFMLLMSGFFYSFVLNHSARSRFEIDANTYYKITANIYGTVGAISMNPLFGVRKSILERDSIGEYKKDYNKNMELIKEGKRKLRGIFEIDKNYKLTQTYHNLYAFYLRHYGIIGFLLLMIVIVKVYQKIKNKIQINDRYMLLGVFIFILQYAILHNTKLITLSIFWILLSLGDENKMEMKKYSKKDVLTERKILI